MVTLCKCNACFACLDNKLSPLLSMQVQLHLVTNGVHVAF